jgi:hypothetical protein
MTILLFSTSNVLSSVLTCVRKRRTSPRLRHTGLRILAVAVLLPSLLTSTLNGVETSTSRSNSWKWAWYLLNSKLIGLQKRYRRFGGEGISYPGPDSRPGNNILVGDGNVDCFYICKWANCAGDISMITVQGVLWLRIYYSGKMLKCCT